jgi:acetoin utilization protein AcuB
MHTGNFRRLPVLQDGRLVGIITDRDLRLATNSPLVLQDKWYSDFIQESIKVKSCMTVDPMTISPEASVIEATKLMRAHKFGGLPVVEDDNLVGMITVTDLLDFLIHLLEAKEATD